MTGAIASLKAPDIFDDIIMIGPSPRYIDDSGYTGGFSEQQIYELLDFLDANTRVGRGRWRPSSWAIPTDPNWGTNSPIHSV
jgi:hypothetical protein